MRAHENNSGCATCCWFRSSWRQLQCLSRQVTQDFRWRSRRAGHNSDLAGIARWLCPRAKAMPDDEFINPSLYGQAVGVPFGALILLRAASTQSTFAAPVCFNPASASGPSRNESAGHEPCGNSSWTFTWAPIGVRFWLLVGCNLAMHRLPCSVRAHWG